MTQKVLLDFSNTKSIEDSVLRSFNNKYPDLVSWVKEIQIPDEKNRQEKDDYIFDLVCNQFGNPVSEYEAVWFHATRVEDSSSFLREGILPTSMAYEKIKSHLIDLSGGLKKYGDYEHSGSSSDKKNDKDEGPFARLFKYVAFSPVGVEGNYLEMPELLQDIAGELLGGNYEQLTARFSKISKSYVISFKDDADMTHLSRGLYYLNLIGHGYTEVDAADTANFGGI
tara:strand:+ start:466 stop:1143 length:678 start_codon:yes stop_codon:yes gene_type:complete